MVCLFLFASVVIAQSQEFSFNSPTREAYTHALNLRFADVRNMIQQPATPQEIYVRSFADALELIVTEDAQLLNAYESAFDARASRKTSKKSADELLVQSEMHLHWAFIYLKFGRELDAAFRLRQAYMIQQDLHTSYPDYKAVYKISGLLNVLIGSVPDKYSWILGLLNMQGSVETGLQQLQELSDLNHDLAFEATLWHAFIQGFMLQNPEKAIAEMNKLSSNSPLTAFMIANFHMKNASGENALMWLQEAEARSQGTRIPYTSYLKGEVYLHKADYANAIAAYKAFLTHYKGQNYVKDAHYKIGLCHWLDEKPEKAAESFEAARNAGKESAEADRHAARNLASREMPSIPLSKVRFYTDGGYYAEAEALLAQVDPEKLTAIRHKAEWYYRKARLMHKVNRLPDAVEMYEMTVTLAGTNDWYYAPNACLQLGYLARQRDDVTEARRWFEKALSYKKHEYKNSIDSKARSALAQLKARK